jgi:putative transposase
MWTARYAYWKALGSQAVQNVAERLDAAYQRFFNKQSGPPRFKKVKRYKSFTLKQTAGWKMLSNNHNVPKPNGKFRRSRGVVEIGGVAYKFVQHRPLCGDVKTVTLKRDALGGLWVCFSVVETVSVPKQVDLSHIGGFDFGLRTFLTDHTGKRWMHPLYFRDVLRQVQQFNRSLNRKQEGSHNRERARRLLARAHIRIADKRRDFHFKLAHELCEAYDVLVFEDLHIAAMKRLWGRKVSDLGFTKFLAILQHVAMLRGKHIVQIDRFEPTTQRCSRCGHQQPMPLKMRQFVCEQCGLSLDRDHNAALNIRRAGASAHGPRGMSVLRK